MIKPTTLIFFLLFFSTLTFAQSQKETDVLSLKKLVEESFQEIFTNLHAEKIGLYYTEDFILIENGEIWNTDSLRNYVAKALLRNPKPVRENKFDFLTMEIMEDIAWVSYSNTATFTSQNSPQRIINWLETIIAVRTKDSWRIKLLHNSPGKK
jgi:hypothetical protein